MISLEPIPADVLPPFDLPNDAWPVFRALHASVQKRVQRFKPVFEAHHAGLITARQAARACGLSLATFNNLRTRWKREGWQALIDNRKLGRATQKVKPVFLPVWHSYVLANNRVTTKAHEALCYDAARGKSIAGYEKWKQWPTPPPGLTYDNLIRARYLPTKAETLLGRVGIAAARKALPDVPQDVSEVRPLEFVLFDDVELDFLVTLAGSFVPVKLRLIVAFDLCSRRILGYGVRPAVERADGVEDGLKLSDMKAVVLRLLRTFGVPTAWTMHFICERGTAAIKDAFKAALAEVTHGGIVVHDTSMIAGRIAGYEDRAVGNSWGKAWLESHFNSLHGVLAAIDGQKGRSYQLQPAELEGRRRHALQLWRAGRHVPIEDRWRFRLPFPSLEEAIAELTKAFDQLDDRDAHTLQGFGRTQIWRLDDRHDWQPLALLPDILADRTDALQWDSRPETPRERWQRLIVDCPRQELSEAALFALLHEQREVRFERYQFRFEYQGTDYIYFADDYLLAQLTDRERYVVWFDRMDMGTIYLTRPRPHLGYLGKLTRFQRVRRGDVAAAQEQIAAKTRVLQHAMLRVQDAKLPQLQQRARDLEDNAALTHAVADAASERDAIADAPLPTAPSADDAALTAAVREGAAAAREQQQRARAAQREQADAISVGRAVRDSEPEASAVSEDPPEVWAHAPAPHPSESQPATPEPEVW